MSVAKELIAIMFGVLFAILILLRLADIREKQRSLRNLPPNTSGGTPIVATRRDRWLAFFFCAFVFYLLFRLIIGST